MKSSIAVYSICVMGLIVAAFYDYPLTDALYHPDFSAAVFFEKFVPVIIYLAAGISCAVVVKVRKRFLPVLLEAAIFAFSYGHGLKAIAPSVSFFSWQFAMFTAAITMGSLLAVRLIPDRYLDKIYPAVRIYLGVLITSVLIVNAVKLLWGRTRYRDLMDVSQFTPWYLPFGNGGASFPSGHTCAVSSVLCLMEIKMKSRKGAWIRNVLVGVLIVVMMITRMMMGAHFLSDTIAGFLVTYTCYLFYSGKMKRRT